MPLSWLNAALSDLDEKSLRRRLTERSSAQRGDALTLGGKQLANFGSNDYLGLAADPRLAAAAAASLATSGLGSGASPLVTGRATEHALLEQDLARFEGTAAALLFSTGFAANVGAITSLVGPADFVFSDAKNHASIIDGCRLSGATTHIYRHADANHLAQLLAEVSPVGGLKHSFPRKLIVTDSLFSMDGDFAPLPQLAELAHQHHAMLLVDEAHATGVLGKTGRGLAEQMGVEDGVHVRVGTLSKALGSFGGIVAGSQELIDWLANRARPYIFSTAMPEALAAASRAALKIVPAEPFRRQSLLASAADLRQQLTSAGFHVGTSTSQIIPVILGDPARTMHFAARLSDAGFFVPGIRPPSVPPGESLLRISLTFLHSPEQISQLVKTFIDCRQAA